MFKANLIKIKYTTNKLISIKYGNFKSTQIKSNDNKLI